MPLIRSAIKRVRTAKRKTLKNRIVKNTTKETMKTFMGLVTDGKIDEARAMFPQVQKVCDTMAKKGLWHANKVARKISRLTKVLKLAAVTPTQVVPAKKKADPKKTTTKPKTEKSVKE